MVVNRSAIQKYTAACHIKVYHICPCHPSFEASPNSASFENFYGQVMLSPIVPYLMPPEKSALGPIRYLRLREILSSHMKITSVKFQKIQTTRNGKRIGINTPSDTQIISTTCYSKRQWTKNKSL